MPSPSLLRVPWLVLLVGMALSPLVAAQRQQPAPQPPAAAAPPPAPPAAVAEPESPAVAAILETKPSTPAEWTRAAKILADLGRPDLAKGFLKQILDAKLNPQQLAGLAEEFGSAVFIRMASRNELAPEATALADAVLESLRQKRRAPQQIAAKIQELSSPSVDVRYGAMNELRQTRGEAVAPLVAVLADPARSAEHPNVRAALARLRSDAVGPLTAMLQAEEPRLVAAAIRVLGDIGARDTTFLLLAPYSSPESDPAVRATAEEALKRLVGQTPTVRESAELLAEHARQYFEGRRPIEEHVPGEAEIWTWDSQKKSPAAVILPTFDASLAVAVRFARDAFSVAPDDPTIRMLYLTAALEQAKYAGGLDKPLEQGSSPPLSLAATLGPDVVEDVLRYAMETAHAPAATAAARLLGDIGDAEKLLNQGSDPAPLVLAARHPDRRVRLAAVGSILKLMPTGAFPGSSYVPEALNFLAATSGRSRAIVAGPSTAESRRVGGWLAEMGYEVDTASTGRALLELALASPDYELILVDSALLAPTVDFVLQQLRRDNRTALMPVGVTARDDQSERGKHLVRNDPLALAFPRPHSRESVEWQVEQLFGLRGRNRVGSPERQQQAALALDWLVRLTAEPTQYHLFNLKGAEQAALAALYVPAFTVRAAEILGNLGTPQAQTALVDLASRDTQPLNDRKAALQAFCTAIEHRGILLRTDQILRQYERYNQSASLDAATQQVLAMVLDCIEAPTVPLQTTEGALPAAQPEAATGN